MSAEMPVSDLSRIRSSERDQSWPDSLQIVATFGKTRKWLDITRDQFFGLGAHGAPLSGEALISAIDRLRLK